MAWTHWEGFDKLICGKWASEKYDINGTDLQIFLNINEDESGVTVKYDFNNDACANTALYVEYSDCALYFFHNDRAHRAEYILVPEGGDTLKCSFSVIGCFGCHGKFTKDIRFTRTEPLSAEMYAKLRQPNIVRLKTSNRLELLREYAEYGDIESDAEFKFSFDERENVLDIIEKYNLDDLVKGKSDVELSISLMNWLCGLYRHGNPPSGFPQKRTPQALMAAADAWESRTNCRGLSLILAQMIRAYGIKAYHVTCSPYEEPFEDCHVVVSVYCESLGKQIMLDPTSNLYLKNSAGEIIGISEFRDILISGGKLIPCDNFNSGWGTPENPEAFITAYGGYMAKNLVRIERYLDNRYGCDGEGGWVVLVPKLYMENEANNFDDYHREDFVTSDKYFWQV